eukprot:2817939-Prymnesium_polylepis.1
MLRHIRSRRYRATNLLTLSVGHRDGRRVREDEHIPARPDEACRALSRIDRVRCRPEGMQPLAFRRLLDE